MRDFPDDTVDAFVKMSAKHGMDIFRVFDALNDMRNIRQAVKSVKEAGKHAQGVICYTSSPVHTIEKFIQQGIEIEEMGCDSICIKDMAGQGLRDCQRIEGAGENPHQCAYPRDRRIGSQYLLRFNRGRR